MEVKGGELTDNEPNISDSQQVLTRVPEGKLHNAVKFLSGELGVGEPLQVDDENLRQRPEIQLLRGQLVLLTHRTVPEGHRHPAASTQLSHLLIMRRERLCVCVTRGSPPPVSPPW